MMLFNQVHNIHPVTLSDEPFCFIEPKFCKMDVIDRIEIVEFRKQQYTIFGNLKEYSLTIVRFLNLTINKTCGKN